VSMLDNNGKAIVFAQGTNEEQITQFYSVVSILPYIGLRQDKEYNQIAVSPIVFTIRTSDKIRDFGFDNNGSTGIANSIWWCPNGGSELNNGEIQSPANGLQHEFGHTARYAVDQAGYEEDSHTETPGPVASAPNVEEERNLKEVEIPFSKAMNEGVRYNYYDYKKPVETEGPLSTTPVK
jgi:hypothetical protein